MQAANLLSYWHVQAVGVFEGSAMWRVLLCGDVAVNMINSQMYGVGVLYFTVQKIFLRISMIRWQNSRIGLWNLSIPLFKLFPAAYSGLKFCICFHSNCLVTKSTKFD
jgi:hypothetical protein